MLYKNAANKIKVLRVQKGLTQKQLAEELNVSDKYISAVELNKKRASMYFYRDIANYFKVTFDCLFSDSLEVKKNFIIDSVVLKLNYMSENEQQCVLDMVEAFSSYTERTGTK